MIEITEKPSNFRETTNIDWKPSVNLGGNRDKEASRAAAGKARQGRRASRKSFPELNTSRKVNSPVASGSMTIEQEELAVNAPVTPDEVFIPINCFTQTDPVKFATPVSVQDVACQTDLSVDDLDKLNDELFRLKDSESTLHLQLAELKLKSVKTSELNEQVLSQNDDLVRFYTGLINFHILITFYNFVERNVSHDSTRNAISKFNEFLIVLIKLRLNVPFKDLAFRFNTSEATVSRIFTKWINGIFETCKKSIVWPEKDVIKNSRNKYSILANNLPIELISAKPDQPVPSIDKIIVICGALINLCPPVVSPKLS